VKSLTTSIRNFFKRASAFADARIAHNKGLLGEPVVTSNLQWHEGVNMLEFLHKVGVHARVNTMLNRERYALSSFGCATMPAFTLPHLASAHG
jgi:tyrosyl-tRNA synthetase